MFAAARIKLILHSSADSLALARLRYIYNHLGAEQHKTTKHINLKAYFVAATQHTGTSSTAAEAYQSRGDKISQIYSAR